MTIVIGVLGLVWNTELKLVAPLAGCSTVALETTGRRELLLLYLNVSLGSDTIFRCTVCTVERPLPGGAPTTAMNGSCALLVFLFRCTQILCLLPDDHEGLHLDRTAVRTFGNDAR